MTRYPTLGGMTTTTVRLALCRLANEPAMLVELDIARLCRQWGLPTPSRQVMRRGKGGRDYLDLCWDDFRLVVELEVSPHARAASPTHDSLRQNALTIGGIAVLRIPVTGLRTDELMSAIQAGLLARGYYPSAA